MSKHAVKINVDARDIKPRDRIVFLDQAKVDWISHLDEFHIRLGYRGAYTQRLAKVQTVTVVREVSP